MPVIQDNDAVNFGTGHYGYSGARLDKINTSTVTLVCLDADTSSSITNFAAEIENGVKALVEDCRRSPHCDSLMLCYNTFASHRTEQHGYKLLQDCHTDNYTGTIRPGGCTVLYDTCFNGVASLRDYGAKLFDAKCTVNGIFVVITDGEDVGSTMTPASIKAELERIKKEEKLESIITILCGVNVQGQLEAGLKAFATAAGFTQFVAIKDTHPGSLAKLMAFISKSVSSQAQAAGSGGPSKTLTL